MECMKRDIRKLDYTDTKEFKETLEELRRTGISDEDIAGFTELCHRFDFFGNDKGTDYSKVDLAYSVEGYTMRSGILQFVGE